MPCTPWRCARWGAGRRRPGISSTCVSSQKPDGVTRRTTDPSGVGTRAQWSYALCVDDEQPIEVTFLVGEWMPAEELVDVLRREREQDDAVDNDGEQDQ